MRSGRRKIRKKGFILSFGDIILPFVGIVAIGLLVVAGKLFFVNGFRPSVSVVPEKIPEIPKSFVPKAEAGGEELKTPAFSPSPSPSSSEQAEKVKPENSSIVPPVSDEKTIPLEILAAPIKQEPVKEDPTMKKAAPEPTAPAAKPARKAQGPMWRVQVGAYNSKSGAKEIVSKLARSGYKATIYSGKKYHKVWVQAGDTKQSAEAVAARLKKTGFPGSYVVPPPSR
ncbi:MAG: SPOR domain-containing protein [Fretibacterium sp.]|nr:SPOR domain-containing protein [Fretibacterium sp.]